MVMGYISGFSSVLDMTLNRGSMTIFEDQVLTRAYCDEPEYYSLSYELNTTDLVFRPELGRHHWVMIGQERCWL